MEEREGRESEGGGEIERESLNTSTGLVSVNQRERERVREREGEREGERETERDLYSLQEPRIYFEE